MTRLTLTTANQIYVNESPEEVDRIWQQNNEFLLLTCGNDDRVAVAKTHVVMVEEYR